jgi:hypothetical protein
MNTIPREDRREACFGMGTITLMKTPRFGHPIDHSKPNCAVCKRTGEKPKAGLGKPSAAKKWPQLGKAEAEVSGRKCRITA